MTVEDTLVRLEEIRHHFGAKVATLVAWLTDVSTPYHGNRAARKALDFQHIPLAPPEAKTIRLADLIGNSRSIKEFDTDFGSSTAEKSYKCSEFYETAMPR